MFYPTEPGKTIAMTDRKRTTHFVRQNKYILLWHLCLAHISNVCIARAFKLVDGIISDFQGIEYGPANMLINFNNSDRSDSSNFKDVTTPKM